MSLDCTAALAGATIAFDLDGTLVDTAPDLIGALNDILREEGLPSAPEAAARILVGRGAKALILRGFALAGQDLDDVRTEELVSRFIEVYSARIAHASRPFPGLDMALSALEAAGARLCVCTNKRTDLSVALLDALGLSARFAAVTGSDLAPTRKPDPSHFVAAIEQAGGEVARSLMVGDSDNDVLSAKGAGAPVVVVDFGYTETPADQLGADAVISAFSELPAVAARLLAARPRPLPGSAGSVIDPAS